MNILIVDNDKAAAEAARALTVAADPCGVCKVYIDPEAALADREIPAEIAFIETVMDSMDGLTFARRLRERFPLCEIVFLTSDGSFMAEAFALHADGYIMKPLTAEKLTDALVNSRRKAPELSDRPVKVRCFGNFEVFVNGAAVRFRRSKSKELLAYLIDRRGAVCSSDMIIGNIWPDGTGDDSHKSMTRVAAKSLLEDFSTLGVERVILHDRCGYCVNTGLLDCDYYRYLECDPYAIRQFVGEYMSQYDFAENTRANLQFRLFGR